MLFPAIQTSGGMLPVDPVLMYFQSTVVRSATRSVTAPIGR